MGSEHLLCVTRFERTFGFGMGLMTKTFAEADSPMSGLMHEV